MDRIHLPNWKIPLPRVFDRTFFAHWSVVLHNVKKQQFTDLCFCFIFFLLQPLVFTTFSLAKAEEMADLIDGYCMLFSGNKHSLVFKKLGRAESCDCTAFIINRAGKKMKSTCPAGQ